MNTQNISKESEEIMEIFKSLPEIIQKAITTSGWEGILRGIVSKYRLRVDYGTKLENMTFALMMGVMEPKEYYDLIHNDFALDADTAEALFEDIDTQVFTHIEEMTRRLEAKESLVNAEKNDKQTFVKEDREMSSQDSEILTITREEILRDIENPEQIKNEDNLPDLKDSFVMPKSMPKEQDPKPVTPNVPISKPEPIPPQVAKPANTSVEVREEQIPSNLPTTESKVSKSIDPVDLGLTNKISTSNNYQAVDPYREPIE